MDTAAIPERKPENTPMHVSEIQLQPGRELTSKENEDVQLYFDRFQGKEFLLSQAQALPTRVTQNAYMREEKIFKETVKEVYVTNVPKDVNVITSHVLYKVKVLDDHSKTVRARIAPHGNKDSEK